MGRVNENNSLRAGNPNAAIGRLAGGEFNVRRLQGFYVIFAVKDLTVQPLGFEAADHKTVPADAKDSVVGMEPQPAVVIRNNGANVVVEQTVVVRPTVHVASLDSCDAAGQTGPEHAAGIFANPQRFVHRQPVCSAEPITMAVIHAENTIHARDENGPVARGIEAANPAKIRCRVGERIRRQAARVHAEQVGRRCPSPRPVCLRRNRSATWGI